MVAICLSTYHIPLWLYQIWSQSACPYRIDIGKWSENRQIGPTTFRCLSDIKKLTLSANLHRAIIWPRFVRLADIVLPTLYLPNSMPMVKTISIRYTKHIGPMTARYRFADWDSIIKFLFLKPLEKLNLPSVESKSGNGPVSYVRFPTRDEWIN